MCQHFLIFYKTKESIHLMMRLGKQSFSCIHFPNYTNILNEGLLLWSIGALISVLLLKYILPLSTTQLQGFCIVQ